MPKHKTLLSYFQTQPLNKKLQPNSADCSVPSSTTKECGLKNIDLNKCSTKGGKDHNEEEQSHQSPVKKKRRCLVDTDSDVSESEASCTISTSNSKAKRRRVIESDDEEIIDNKSESLPGKGAGLNNQGTPNSCDTSAIAKSLAPALCSFEYNGETNPKSCFSPNFTLKHKTPAKLHVNDQLGEKFLHENLKFLSPDIVMDAKQRKFNDPMYDKTTLYVPSEFLKKQTPAMYQWWKLKSNNYDVILFFKVGKFYELYHMDAVIGVQHLGLIYMKGSFAHCGFPEISYGRYSDALVEKGFTVARVEQTETPEDNRVRIKGSAMSKHDKTLRREICRITTKGTKIPTFWEGSSMRNEHNYLLAIKEKPNEGGKPDSCRQFGVCFVDTTLCVFHMGQFIDDVCCSKLCTLLGQYPPSQVLYERAAISCDFAKILQAQLATVMQTSLVTGSQFWDAAKTLHTLSSEKYFCKGEETNWPTVIEKMILDTLGLVPKQEFELAISSLGACVYYLKKCLIDFQIISLSQFQEYSSVHNNTNQMQNCNMVLDSICIKNLEVFKNSKNGREGTLLDCLDSCQTSFGKRLLYQWISVPSCCLDVINDRLDAIEDLLQSDDVVVQLKKLFSKMPDLERMLSNIYFQAKGSIQDDHPEKRAILYEDEKYSKKKISIFITILEQYEATFQCIKNIQPDIKHFRSTLLKDILRMDGDCGSFPDLGNTINKWKKIFCWEKAQKSGKIIPQPGTNPKYDEAITDIKCINNELEQYLLEQQKTVRCSQIAYKGSGNKRFQMEMPEFAAKSLSSEYVICGQRKGYKSFRTAETENFLKKMEYAENQRDVAQAETMSILFAKFTKDWEMWMKVIQYLSITDVLICFANFSRGTNGNMCRPILLNQKSVDPPSFKIESSRHPCISQTFMQNDFIPNDIVLGGTNGEKHLPSCLLLTGPNMGGKSTLMRQVGLLTILAQIGCYVPAERFELTPCDRIFTRLGASDRIMSGESTFFVELSETSSILKHASPTSLVLLDELGRGTATYDGTAIAHSVLTHISKSVGCRTIFSTHYHTLVEECSLNSVIMQGHMAIMIEESNEENDDMLTFLYKLKSGSCPKSYGFFAAKLAGIPLVITKMAKSKAHKMEETNNRLVKFRKTWLTH